jgi:hypothetical protein
MHADYLVDELNEIAVPLVAAILEGEDMSDAVLANAYVFVERMLKDFPSAAIPVYSRFIPSIEVVARDSSEGNRTQSQALFCIAQFANVTHDTELASSMQEFCCQLLLNEEADVVIEALDCCELIAPVLPADLARQLFLDLIELITDEPRDRLVAQVLPPMDTFIKYAAPENSQLFLTRTFEIVDSFLHSTLPCQSGRPPTASPHFLTTSILDLIAHLVRVPSDGVDRLCEFLLTLMSQGESALLFSVIGAFSDAIAARTVSDSIINALLTQIPNFYGSSDPDVQQNVAWLLNCLVQAHPATLPAVVAPMPVLWRWFVAERSDPAFNSRLQISHH